MINQAWIKQQRAEAAQWVHDLLLRDFVIFDGETTGLDPDDEFVQVAAIDHTGAVLLDALLKPAKRISPKASAVHGIRAEHVVDAPAFPDVFPELAEVLKGKLVVAYNVDFDRRILRQTCKRYDLPRTRPGQWECAMMMYAQYHGEWNSYRNSFRWKSLTDACAFEGVVVENAHAAVGDCLLTLRLIEKMATSAGE